ncbi:MAG TPA: hypothetical protein VHO24_08480 [Opitutaceae bacterium]|nr:hypothetical protein [Opitutaceae bacterium]
MGFFDRFSSKKAERPVVAPASEPEAGALASGGGVIPRLAEARAKLEEKDLPGALAIYDEVLAQAGDRADVLVTISGDLGSNGHLPQIVELVAPRYDADRHGPATGLNLLQAYLALRHAEAAQHVLDILFALKRPELEDRLHGFSNAIADLIAQGAGAPAAGPEGPGASSGVAKVALITISKPIWFYGLEPLAAEILPEKEGSLRRIAFAQLALPGAYPDVAAAMKQPEDELGRLSRAIPLWFAETFYFSPHYSPIAAVGLMDHPVDGKLPMLFSTEWTAENLRQLVDTTQGGLDYVITGALKQTAGDYELMLRVWEVKKFRERKQFVARWTPATANAELGKLHAQVRVFMEWSSVTAPMTYTPPTAPRVWLDALGASLGYFLLGKNLLAKEQLPPLAPVLNDFSAEAVTTAATSLAWLTLLSRARAAGMPASIGEVQLSMNPRVAKARQLLG